MFDAKETLMILPTDHVEHFNARERARQRLAETQVLVREFKSLEDEVDTRVPATPPTAVSDGQPHLEALRAVRAAITAELAKENAFREDIERARVQIQVDERRRVQVIVGMVAITVLLVAILLLAVV